MQKLKLLHMKKNIIIIILKAIGAIVAVFLGYLGVAACTSCTASRNYRSEGKAVVIMNDTTFIYHDGTFQFKSE